MNAAFELLQAEVSGRSKPKVEIGSLKAIDVVKGSIERRPLKVAKGWLSEGQAHERGRVRRARRRSVVVRSSIRRYRSKRTARVPQR
jgi:hypothetical protein